MVWLPGRYACVLTYFEVISADFGAEGVFLLWIGLVNSHTPATLVGGIAGMAVFMDA